MSAATMPIWPPPVPVRLKIREEINEELAASADARDSRDALCAYIREHTLADSGLNLAQYISLALYLTPPPELTPTVDETELPPDSTQVVNILPLLRNLQPRTSISTRSGSSIVPSTKLSSTRIHDPLTQMILDTNIYLRLPVSSYDGRRFLVLLEPMLAPSATNARIYGNDYIVVASPAARSARRSPHGEIRHTYLHYEVEPLVYARAAAMDRLLPLLKPVQDAPLDFTYKSDIVGAAHRVPHQGRRGPDDGRRHRQTETSRCGDEQRADHRALRRRDGRLRSPGRGGPPQEPWTSTCARDGCWSTTSTTSSGQMEKESISLKDDIGEMVYGMDVDRERHRDEQIVFLPEGTHDVVRRVPRQLTGLELAEMKMLKGDPGRRRGDCQEQLSPTPRAITPRPTTSWPAST